MTYASPKSQRELEEAKAHSKMRRQQKQAEEKKAFAMQWRWHHDALRRVWRTDWSGDMFEILDQREFRELRTVARRFSFSLTEAPETEEEE